MQKIMFNDKYELTDAVIEYIKTMTRRIIPDSVVMDYNEDYDLSGVDMETFIHDHSRYKVGEVVAVAQSYKHIYCLEPHQRLTEEYSVWFLHQEGLTYTKGWKNKMFVKPDFMPHQIRITGIKVERLQDISNEDCLKEGVYKDEDGGRIIGYPFGIPFYYTFFGAKNKEGKQLHWTTPYEAFAALIDKVSGKGPWEKNPWVFAYEFELIR